MNGKSRQSCTALLWDSLEGPPKKTGFWVYGRSFEQGFGTGLAGLPEDVG